MANHYLVKVLSVHTLPCLQSDEKDAYGHKYSAGMKVVKGHYLELVPGQESVHFVDIKTQVIIPIFLVVSQCPELIMERRKVRRKQTDVYIVSMETHEILLSFTV